MPSATATKSRNPASLVTLDDEEIDALFAQATQEDEPGKPGPTLATTREARCASPAPAPAPAERARLSDEEIAELLASQQCAEPQRADKPLSEVTATLTSSRDAHGNQPLPERPLPVVAKPAQEHQQHCKPAPLDEEEIAALFQSQVDEDMDTDTSGPAEPMRDISKAEEPASGLPNIDDDEIEELFQSQHSSPKKVQPNSDRKRAPPTSGPAMEGRVTDNLTVDGSHVPVSPAEAGAALPGGLETSASDQQKKGSTPQAPDQPVETASARNPEHSSPLLAPPSRSSLRSGSVIPETAKVGATICATPTDPSAALLPMDAPRKTPDTAGLGAHVTPIATSASICTPAANKPDVAGSRATLPHGRSQRSGDRRLGSASDRLPSAARPDSADGTAHAAAGLPAGPNSAQMESTPLRAACGASLSPGTNGRPESGGLHRSGNPLRSVQRVAFSGNTPGRGFCWPRVAATAARARGARGVMQPLSMGLTPRTVSQSPKTPHALAVGDRPVGAHRLKSTTPSSSGALPDAHTAVSRAEAGRAGGMGSGHAGRAPGDISKPSSTSEHGLAPLEEAPRPCGLNLMLPPSLIVSQDDFTGFIHNNSTEQPCAGNMPPDGGDVQRQDDALRVPLAPIGARANAQHPEDQQRTPAEKRLASEGRLLSVQGATESNSKKTGLQYSDTKRVQPSSAKRGQKGTSILGSAKKSRNVKGRTRLDLSDDEEADGADESVAHGMQKSDPASPCKETSDSDDDVPVPRVRAMTRLKRLL